MLESQPAAEELKARVERERHFYNEKEPKKPWAKRTYVKLLKHAYDNPSNKRGLAAMREAIMPGHGGHVLEIGCRAWPMWITLGKCRPKKLTCINISESELEIGKQLAREANLDIEFEFLLMDAHSLSFADNTFDAVYGGGILHHLDYRVALPECNRVLKPGGVCVFGEPLRLNPFGQILRFVTPGARTDDEVALGYPELELFEQIFDADTKYFQLVGFLLGVVSPIFWESPINPLMRFADKIDQTLLGAAPRLGPYCRYAILSGRKRA